MNIPFDPAAEIQALACVLSGESEAAGMLARLEWTDFHELPHQTIFGALCSLAEDRAALDTPSLYERLRQRNELEAAGGFEFVSTLPDKVISAANFDSILGILKNQAERRAMVAEADELYRKAGDLSVPVEAKRTSKLPAVIDAAKFSAVKMDEPVQLIRGILHRGCKLALGGGSKTFKSWSLIDLALSVSSGRQWLSFHTTRARVAYINFELPDWSFHSRLNAVAVEKEITIQPGWLTIWNLRGHSVCAGEIVPQLAAELKSSDIGLVIVDPTYKLLGNADENSARDINALLNHFESLARETGAAIAFASHFSKGNQAGKEAVDRISGSGVFARDPDAILTFTKHEQEGAFVVDSTLRNCGTVAPFVVRWDYPLMRMDEELDPTKLKQAKGGRTKQHDPEKLCAAIVDSTAETPVSVSEWAEAAEIARPTLYDYLPGLRAKGWIATAGEGSSARRYLTDKGREAAKRYIGGVK